MYYSKLSQYRASKYRVSLNTGLFCFPQKIVIFLLFFKYFCFSTAWPQTLTSMRRHRSQQLAGIETRCRLPHQPLLLGDDGGICEKMIRERGMLSRSGIFRLPSSLYLELFAVQLRTEQRERIQQYHSLVW